MAFGTLIAGSIASGLISGFFGNKAAKAQAKAALTGQRESNELLERMFQQGRRDQEPFRQAGIRSLGTLEEEIDPLTRAFSLDDFQQDPGFLFRQSEGEKGIERAAAARGGFDSGATLKALTRFNQDIASNEFTNAFNRDRIVRGDRFNRLLSLVGRGQGATNQITQLGANIAGQQANNIVNAHNLAGNARASGFANLSNSLTGGISSAANSFNLNSLLKTHPGLFGIG